MFARLRQNVQLQDQPIVEPTKSIQCTVKFIQIAFVIILQKVEEILEDAERKERLVHLNYYFSVLLKWLESLENAKVMNLLSVALLLPISQFEDVELKSMENDIFYAQAIQKS